MISRGRYIAFIVACAVLVGVCGFGFGYMKFGAQARVEEKLSHVATHQIRENLGAEPTVWLDNRTNQNIDFASAFEYIRAIQGAYRVNVCGVRSESWTTVGYSEYFGDNEGGIVVIVSDQPRSDGAVEKKITYLVGDELDYLKSDTYLWVLEETKNITGVNESNSMMLAEALKGLADGLGSVYGTPIGDNVLDGESNSLGKTTTENMREVHRQRYHALVDKIAMYTALGSCLGALVSGLVCCLIYFRLGESKNLEEDEESYGPEND